MSSYLSHCKICDNEYTGKENWTRHLLQEDHQEKARVEWEKWEETKKNCALVAFFSVPVTSEDEGASNLVVLLWKYLKRIVDGNGVCEDDSSLHIADYIWWKERPMMAVILFESCEIADQLHSEIVKVGEATGGEPLKIGSYFVHFKKLVDLTPSEWKNQLPDSIQGSQSSEPSTSLGSHSVQKRKRTPSCSSDDLGAPTGNVNEASNIPTSTSALVNQFNSLLKSVEIPSSDIQQTTQILEQVKALVASEFPTCQVYLFRHGYLNIRNPFCNDVLIFLHGGPTSTNQVAKLAVVQEPTLFWLIYGEEPKYKNSQPFQVANSSAGSPSLFWVFTDQAYLLEVQLNRLFEYMLTFDPKCNLLLSCLHYFFSINSCYFGDLPNKSETVEWLLLFFLIKEKKIPSVRQILDQPHQPVMLPNFKRNVDIGFNPDPDFANKWKMPRGTHKAKEITEEYVCDVLRQFQAFLRFAGKILSKGSFILNTRDGETQNRKQVLFQPRTKWQSKLSNEEVEVIKSNPAHGGETSKWPFSIVHPLVLDLNLGYNLEEYEVASNVMKRGVFHLNRFLNLSSKERYVERWVQKKGDLPEIYNDLERALKIEDAPELVPKKEKKKWKGFKN